MIRALEKVITEEMTVQRNYFFHSVCFSTCLLDKNKQIYAIYV